MKSILSNASGFIAASHEDPRNPGVLKRVIATKHDFQEGHVQMLNWARLPAGSWFQLHYHEDMQEVFVLLKGYVEMRVAGESTMMAAFPRTILLLGKTISIRCFLVTDTAIFKV